MRASSRTVSPFVARTPPTSTNASSSPSRSRFEGLQSRLNTPAAQSSPNTCPARRASSCRSVSSSSTQRESNGAPRAHSVTSTSCHPESSLERPITRTLGVPKPFASSKAAPRHARARSVAPSLCLSRSRTPGKGLAFTTQSRPSISARQTPRPRSSSFRHSPSTQPPSASARSHDDRSSPLPRNQILASRPTG